MRARSDLPTREERRMRDGGLSKAGLGRLHDLLAGYVERGEVPGAVTVISRRGETHVDAIGTKATDGAEPMRRDTIFRITSMTKPVAAAAAMILVEEGELGLDEPVDRLLPELADRKVLKRLDGPLEDTVPANRAIRWRRSCANASSSRSACTTPPSACRQPSWIGWPPATCPIPPPGRSSSSTASTTASGAGHPPSPTLPEGWSRPPTTTWPSAGCCSTTASTEASASSPGTRSRR